ncbi:hypothetical protein DPMN_128724 [Dreissena polymorpha]|uniref:Uncharacterized protein n=1 Tax=Dreissena polymorpha TaxID=45954 RepID=A0A9D4H1T2_DREPO|nr:hypothetical protein DPMN_128724 [Dreissena polymorpha]
MEAPDVGATTGATPVAVNDHGAMETVAEDTVEPRTSQCELNIYNHVPLAI